MKLCWTSLMECLCTQPSFVDAPGGQAHTWVLTPLRGHQQRRWLRVERRLALHSRKLARTGLAERPATLPCPLTLQPGPAGVRVSDYQGAATAVTPSSSSSSGSTSSGGECQSPNKAAATSVHHFTAARHLLINSQPRASSRGRPAVATNRRVRPEQRFVLLGAALHARASKQSAKECSKQFGNAQAALDGLAPAVSPHLHMLLALSAVCAERKCCYNGPK